MKPDHLGDLLMVTAVLPLLAQRYPNAAIDLLCGPWGGAVLGNNPALRRLLPLTHLFYDRRPVSRLRKLLDFCRSLGRTVGLLKAERYDLCLNFRDAGGDLILLARLGGCRHIVGHATGGGGALLDTVVPWTEGRHEVEHFLEVVRPLGIEADLADLRYRIFPQPADHGRVNGLIEQYGLGRFAVIQPGSGDRRKLRPAAFWAGLIGTIDPSWQIVLSGSKDEEPLCREIAGHTDRPLVCLAGELTVAQLYLLLQKAAVLHALDSLAAHLGAAAGVATIVYWSETNDPGQWRPLGKTVEVRN
jgi:heptosyltransferase-3